MAEIPANMGAIGDVKYSLLPPEEFIVQNGDGWVLMQGQNIQGTPLGKALPKITNLPDGRGMFIRAMNESRTGEFADEDGNRQIGSVQKGSVGKHKHPIHDPGHTHHVERDGAVMATTPTDIRTKKGFHMGGKDYEYAGISFFQIQWGASNISVLENENDGIETRPNNIALYLYVKIR